MQPMSRNHVNYNLDADQFIVTFNKMATVDENHRMGVINKILKDFNSEGSYVRKMFDGSYVVKLDPPIPAKDVPRLKGTLESKAEIHIAEIDQIQQAFAVPSDPDFNRQWAFTHERGSYINDAWDSGARGQNTVIAVVDSGITPHPDLDRKVLPGYDMITDGNMSRDRDYGRDNNPNDEGDWTRAGMCGTRRDHTSSWHGMHVAGIAAADTDNNRGVAGVAPDAMILPVRALGACGGRVSDIADDIAWAAGAHIDGAFENTHKADVINLSLGGVSNRCSPAYQAAIDFANKQGSTVVVAAGNENTPTSGVQPANCNNVLVVGATGPEGHRTNYSNYGNEVDIAAPGGHQFPQGECTRQPNYEAGIWSTVNEGRWGQSQPGYAYMNGTSMATPLVSDVVALVKSARPGISNAEVKQVLRRTASAFTTEPTDNFGNNARKTRQLGAGIVNAQAAVCDALRIDGCECRVANPVPLPAPEPVIELPQPQPQPLPAPAPVPAPAPSVPQPAPDKDRNPWVRVLSPLLAYLLKAAGLAHLI